MSLRRLWKLWFFLSRQGKSNRNTDSTKVQYALTLTEFVFHCLPNAPRCPKKKGVSCMETLMSHFPMKGQNFAHFFSFYFFSMHVLPFTMIFFLFNWLVSSFFLTDPPPLPYLKRKRNAVLPDISPFSSFPRVVPGIHPSLPFFREFSLLSLPPFFLDLPCAVLFS